MKQHDSSTPSQPDARRLRSFGLLVGLVLVTLGAWQWWHEWPWWWVPTGVGALLAILGLTAPRILRHPFRAWMAAAAVLGWLSTRVILTLTFYLLLTPISLVMRLLGQDPLSLRRNRTRASFWLKREKQEFDRSYFERQF
ncbi:MAG: SxtJ family membrane protein [bacterium]